jgi:hypothetical protein
MQVELTPENVIRTHRHAKYPKAQELAKGWWAKGRRVGKAAAAYVRVDFTEAFNRMEGIYSLIADNLAKASPLATSFVNGLVHFMGVAVNSKRDDSVPSMMVERAAMMEGQSRNQFMR